MGVYYSSHVQIASVQSRHGPSLTNRAISYYHTSGDGLCSRQFCDL